MPDSGVANTPARQHVEQEERESTGIARNQHVIYTLPHDAASAAQVLGPALERIDDSVPETQVLVITADGESAVAIVGIIAGMLGNRPVRAVPVTSVRRAQRLTKDRPAQVVAGAPAQLLTLLQAATLKLAGVKSLVLAWADDIVATDASAELEAVMGEVPRDAARTLVTSHSTPAVEALVERYLRRGRRAGTAESSDEVPGVAIQYVSVSAGSRSAALGRLLDELDPAGATVFVRSPESAAEAERALAAMGHRGEDATVRVTHGPATTDAPLMVLYDIPASRAELREAIGPGDRQVVALARPRQLPLLRTLAAGGAVSALVLSEAIAAARSREERIRSELRQALAGGAPAREMLALEPLLGEFDGIELAAAALRLLEQARASGGAPVQASAAAGSAAAGGQWRRLFMSVGARDNVRPGDLVGAIAGEGGITSEQIGKIDLRDNHALVEISSGVAGAVAAKMTGTMIRGRRITARLEEERPARPAGDRPRPPRDAGDRPRRDGGDRPRRDAGDRPPRRDFGDKPPRRDFSDRPPRRDAGDRPPRREASDRSPRREGGDRPRPGAPRGRPRDRE